MEILTDQNFNDKIATGLSIVKFGADWCPQCKAIGRILENLNIDRDVKIYEVDVDEVTELNKRFNIQSLPITKIFIDGVEKDSIQGMTSRTKLINVLNNLN